MKLKLGAADIQSLSKAITGGKLPQLKSLNLLGNILTGCLKDLFQGQDYPGFVQMEKLDLEETHLNQEDIERIGEAIRAGKLPQLKELILCANTLTGCLKKLFQEPHHPRFPRFDKLDLRFTHLNWDDLESLSEVVRAGKLSQLKEMKLSQSTLTGWLKDLFGGPENPRFPSLERLDLNCTQLNCDDVESLSEAIVAGKLPQLMFLDLEQVEETGILQTFVDNLNCMQCPSLERLEPWSTRINWEDMQCLLKALVAGKLPQLQFETLDFNHCCWTCWGMDVGPHDSQLNQDNTASLKEVVMMGHLRGVKVLSLSDNYLTNSLVCLFGGPNHPGFPSLEELNLSFTHLTPSDMKSLGEATWAEKLPQLKDLNLNNNILIGGLKFLFRGPSHPGFHSLEKVHLFKTVLTQDDVESLSEAIGAGKLPHLRYLDLALNYLSIAERELEALVSACDAHCKEWVLLELQGTKLRKEFIEKCRDKYRNVMITWCWRAWPLPWSSLWKVLLWLRETGLAIA